MNDLNMKQEDDEYLLLYMADKDEDPVNAKLAFGEFFQRYEKFVGDLCQGILLNIIDSKGPEDLCMEVFYRIFEKSGTYDPAEATSQSDVRKRIELWISRIANNIAIDWYRSNKKRLVVYEEYIPICKELKNSKPTEWIPLNEQAAKAFEEEFEKLDERDREIVILSGLYFDLEKGKSDMPSEVINYIAEKHGTKPENIRQIRSRFKRRVIKKIK